jgi:hypothetical protein
MASTMMGIGCLASLCYGVVGIPFWIISLINAQKALSISQMYGDEKSRQKAKTARLVSGISLGLVGLVVAIYAFALIIQVIANVQGGY